MDHPKKKIAQSDAKHAGSWNSRGVKTKIYKCHKFDCDFETTDLLPRCPKCGWNLLDPQTVHIFGVVLAVLGAMLAVGGGALIVLISTWPRPKGNGHLIIYGVLGVLTLLGLSFFLAGFSQAITGRKNFKLMVMAIVLVALLGVAAGIVRIFA